MLLSTSCPACYGCAVGQRGELFSSRTTVGNRTYFFNVKENRAGDIYLNVVESKKRGDDAHFERHSIMIFEEDMGGFLASFDKAIRFIRAREQTRRGWPDTSATSDRLDSEPERRRRP